MRKGSLAGPIALLGITIAAIILPVQDIAMARALSGEATETIGDLRRVSGARAFADMYFYSFAPMSGAYSMHETSYQLGKRGGGVDWRDDNLDSRYVEIYKNLRDQSTKYLSDTFEAPTEGTTCQVKEVSEFDLQPWSTPMKDLKAGIFLKDALKAKCSYAAGTVTLKGSDKSFYTVFNASDNRFLVMAKETVRFFRDVKNEWRRVDEYEGSYRECPAEEDEVEKEAESEALDRSEEVEDLFQNVVADYPDSPGFKITKAEIIDQNQQFRYGSTDLFEGSADYETFSYECNCDSDGDDCETGWDSTVTITPETTRVTFYLKDSKYRIPTQEAWENLLFKVEPYTHEFR